MSAPPLLSAAAYQLQFERLRQKARVRKRSRELQSEGVSLSAVQGHVGALCERIARDVSSGQFEFSPLTRVETFTQGKLRTIHRAELVDALVLGALAQRLTALLEPMLDDSVCAYRPGRSPLQAIGKLQESLSRHRARHANPTERGVFVLQRDLSAFGESIPTHEDSQLWPLLETLFSRVDDPVEARVLRRLLPLACRPAIRHPDGTVAPLEHGLPTGSPIQQPLANLYLTPLDAALAELRLGFYARFGDDLFVMDEAPTLVQRSASVLLRECEKLELRFNADKSRDLYFTNPGRPFTGESEVVFQGASHVEYLGVRLNFGGRLGLKRKRMRELLLRTRLRIENTVALAPKESALPTVAQVLRCAFFEDTTLGEVLGHALRDWVDDRDQLRQLDRAIAERCASALSGRRGVRALRETPPRALRAAGLPSLLELRRRKDRDE